MSILAPPAAIAGHSAYDDTVKDFIFTLESHMKNCEKLGRYEEADVARMRLIEVKEHELYRRKEAMRSRHLAEMLGVEENYMHEFAAFTTAWQQKMAIFEEKAAWTMADLKAKHDAELRDYQQKLLVKSAIPRHSKEYFNLRKIEEYLAKQKNYVAANAMKEKADAMEMEEEEKWNSIRQEELLSKEAALRNRQEVEAEGVRDKMASQRTELERQRKKELEGLLIRYNNAKSEAERHQKMEKMSFDKALAAEMKLLKGSASSGKVR